MRAARPSSIALACVLPLAACSYDWSRGALPADAGRDGETDVGESGRDAALDSPLEVEVDSAPLADTAADSTVDAADGDGATDGAVDCAALTADVVAARGRAKVCVSGPTACTTTVVDECGCASTVGSASAPEAKDYADAARTLRESGCKVRCGTVCAATRPGFCLVDDAGTGTACAGA